MAYNFAPLKARLMEVEEWLRKELSGIRTGRAAPAILDNIRVESYGAQLPLNQVGSVSIEDARTLRISPWDATQIKVIEKAISDANLGVSCASDERGLRIAFPELTGERRTQLLKVAKGKFEEARVSVRAERDRVRQEVIKEEKDGTIGTDERHRTEEELQKLVDAANGNLDAAYGKKEREITN